MSAVAEAVTAEAESIAELKDYLRIETAAEDAILARLLEVAMALCEEFTGTLLTARSVKQAMPAAADWRRLSLTPVHAIEGVDRIAADGATSALPLDAFAIDIDANGDGWVRMTQPGSAQRIMVRYRAGRADNWGGVPAPLRQGIVRLAAHLYAHRDAADDSGPPAAVAALWRPWRRMRLR